MTVREIPHGSHRYIWDTADTKPTAATHGCSQGDTGYDRQTGIMYICYDGTNWAEKDTVVRLETSPTIDIGDVTLLAGTAVVGKVRGVTATGDEVTDDTADAVKVITVGNSVTQTKTLVGGANSAFDVLSESAGAGTDWDFAFDGAGEIDDIVLVIATTALTAETSLHLFSSAPACNLNDNVANTSPVAADVPTFLGAAELVALRDYGTTGLSYAHISKSTPGGLPIQHPAGAVYGVLISVDAMTPGNVLATLTLHSTMKNT